MTRFFQYIAFALMLLGMGGFAGAIEFGEGFVLSAIYFAIGCAILFFTERIQRFE